jgi:MFS family permease
MDRHTTHREAEPMTLPTAPASVSAPASGDSPADAERATPPGALVRRQDVQILLLSRMATALGLATLSYGAMVFLAQEGAAQLQVSLMGVTRYAAALLFGLGGGLMADAMSKRGALVASYSIQAAACILIPLLFGTALPSLLAVIALAAVFGQLSTPAVKSAVALVAAPADVATVSALIAVAGGIAAAAGASLLAPVLISAGGIQLVLWVAAAVLAVGAIRARALPEEPDKADLRRAFGDIEWRATFPSLPGVARWMFDHKGPASMMLFGAAALALFDGINSLMPIYVRDVLGVDPAAAVWVMAPGAFGFALGAVLGPLLIVRVGERALLGVALLAMFSGAVGFALVDQLTPLLAPFSPLRPIGALLGRDVPRDVLTASMLAIPAAFGSTLGGASVQTYINRRVPLAEQGATFGRQEVIENALTLTMILLLGVVSALVGPRWVFVVGPAILFLLVLTVVRYAYSAAGAAPPTYRQAAGAVVTFGDLPFDQPAPAGPAAPAAGQQTSSPAARPDRDA